MDAKILLSTWMPKSSSKYMELQWSSKLDPVKAYRFFPPKWIPKASPQQQ